MRGELFQLARPLTRETERQLMALVGLLFSVAGTGGLLVSSFTADVAHPLLLSIIATSALATGVLLLAGAQWDVDFVHRRFPVLAHILVLVATLHVALAQYATGPEFTVAAIVFVEVPIFGFYLLRVGTAVASVALIGVCFLVVLLVQDGYVAPVGQWAYLVGTVLAVGLVFGGLLRRSVDDSAQVDRLRRFLPEAVADAVLSSDGDVHLAPHRRQIAVLFCDLRGFTRFTGIAEPEEVVEILDAYYETVGTAIASAHGTIGAYAGDGVMAYFNDPFPIDDPAGTAVHVARDLRGPLDDLVARWGRRGFELGYGVGIAYGYATLGVVGHEGRHDYTALGSVVNLASRLSGEATHREIVVDQKTADAIGDRYRLDPCELELKGFGRVVAFRVDPVDVSVLL